MWRDVGGVLRELAFPSVPEPIGELSWRRLARAKLVLIPVLFVLNIAGYFLIAALADPELDLGAYGRFLRVNLPAHAIVFAINLWLVVRPRGEPTWRTATYVSIPFELWTGVTGLWLMGSVTSWNLLWFVGFIAVYRVYLDARFGLVTLATVCVLHAGLVVIEVAGGLPSHPLHPMAVMTEYERPTEQLVNMGWLLILYLFAWVAASYAAGRIRGTEHALRQLAAGLEGTVRDQVAQLERASRLRRYLAPQLVEQILASDVDPVAVRERRAITVMFADLRGFTQMVERVDPDVLADVLNRYFNEVARIAFRHGGTIDKFIGDAVMVFFGAPQATGDRDQAVRCVRMACEIQQRVAELADDFVRRGAGGPLAVRIGIGSGLATVGAFGADHRSDFTVVGAPVNRAARLEPLAPIGGILVDDETHVLLGDEASCAPHGEVVLKGFTRPITAWRVDAFAADRAGKSMSGVSQK